MVKITDHLNMFFAVEFRALNQTSSIKGLVRNAYKVATVSTYNRSKV